MGSCYSCRGRYSITTIGRLVGIVLGVVISLSVVIYIMMTFFARPVRCWKSVSDYSLSLSRAVPMLLHWVFGSIAILIGWLQFLPRSDPDGADDHHTNDAAMTVVTVCPATVYHKMQYICSDWRRQMHRWNGRVYCMSMIITAIAGLAYIGMNGTVGGVAMSISFGLYGIGILVFATIAWIRAHQVRWEVTPSVSTSFTILDSNIMATQQRRASSHREWALRLFWFAFASPFYRVLIFPLFWERWMTTANSAAQHYQQPLRESVITYLNVCAYLMYIPYMCCEVWLQHKRRAKTLRARIHQLLYGKDKLLEEDGWVLPNSSTPTIATTIQDDMIENDKGIVEQEGLLETVPKPSDTFYTVQRL